jgi:hypothetical protein
MPDANWIEIYRAENIIEAQMFCDALQAAGVPALVDGEWLSSSAGAIPLGWSTAPRILCPPDRADEARALVEEMETQELGEEGLDEDWDAPTEDTPEA